MDTLNQFSRDNVIPPNTQNVLYFLSALREIHGVAGVARTIYDSFCRGSGSTKQ